MAAIAHTMNVSPQQPLKVYEGTLDAAAISYATTAMVEQDITISGIDSGEKVVSFYATDQVTFGIANARVSDDDTLSVMFVATDTDTAVNPAATINYRLITIPA